MATTNDPFTRLVREARRQLSQAEGEDVSERELIRRMDYPDSERSKIQRHFQAANFGRVHNVPAELLDRLAKVTAIPREDWLQAAHEAAGYNTPLPEMESPAVAAARFFNATPSVGERAAMAARLQQILAEEQTRQAQLLSGASTDEEVPEATGDRREGFPVRG